MLIGAASNCTADWPPMVIVRLGMTAAGDMMNRQTCWFGMSGDHLLKAHYRFSLRSTSSNALPWSFAIMDWTICIGVCP